MAMLPIKNRVIPVLPGRGSHNQSQEKNQQNNNSKPSLQNNQSPDGFDDAPKTKVPVHLHFDAVGRATGQRSFRVCEWSATQAGLNQNIKVNVAIDGQVPDGKATLQIIHRLNGVEAWVDSVDGHLQKGIVTGSWKAKAKITNWNVGYYIFIVIAGGANCRSSNSLKLT
jgi:acetolactate synthase regulatory subunit